MFSEDMISEEQKFQQVRAFLDSEIIRLTALIEEYRESIKEQGEEFNRDNPNGGMYSGIELTEIHYDMEQKMLYSQEAAEDIYFYKKLRSAPYFARVDFQFDGATAPKKIYIGLKTLQDPDSYDVLVCDWRAPIASLFYEDFPDDRAYFEAPKGKIEGTLLLKRQYKFQDDCLYYFVDSDLKIDDDILRDVLSKSSGEHLKVIVNSIQREQNKAIRYTSNENVLVLGPAGSGKTSVGFHRLAYLLYQNRNEISSAEIVMFSNNDIFSSYVADIIPELGEKPINYASFYSIFAAEIPTMNVSDYYALADSVIEGNAKRSSSAGIKMGEDFIKFLDENGNDCEPQFFDISYGEWCIVSKETLYGRFYDDTASTVKAKGERLAAFVQAEIENFFEENKKEIYAYRDMTSEIDEDTGKVIRRDKKSLKGSAVEMIKHATLVDPVAVYLNILKKYSEKINAPELLDSTKSLQKGYLEFEDALGIVYLKTILGTSAVLSGVKHLLVDEAQDFSVIQHEILKKIFPRARVTLLADTNQAIVSSINTVDSEKLASLYDAKVMTLNKSYRSTREINEFALSLLDEGERYDIFQRNGEPVAFTKGGLEALKKSVAELNKGNKTSAIITKTADGARKLYAGLKQSCPEIRLCDNKSCQLSDAPVVMPLALTKGLEFDSVLIYDENGNFTAPENKRYLYLAATRALHRLEVFGRGASLLSEY